MRWSDLASYYIYPMCYITRPYIPLRKLVLMCLPFLSFVIHGPSSRLQCIFNTIATIHLLNHCFQCCNLAPLIMHKAFHVVAKRYIWCCTLIFLCCASSICICTYWFVTRLVKFDSCTGTHNATSPASCHTWFLASYLDTFLVLK